MKKNKKELSLGVFMEVVGIILLSAVYPYLLSWNEFDVEVSFGITLLIAGVIIYLLGRDTYEKEVKKYGRNNFKNNN